MPGKGSTPLKPLQDKGGRVGAMYGARSTSKKKGACRPITRGFRAIADVA